MRCENHCSKKYRLNGDCMLMRNKVIAAIRTKDELMIASLSEVKIIFDLNPNILTIEENLNIAHKANKKYFIHIDLAEGIGKDKSGIEYVKKLKVDGIISTRTSIIKAARELGIFTVQRFFIVDSHSIETTVESIKTSKPQMIEIMPGSVLKVISRLKESLDIPIIAGGLIETEEEAMGIIQSGASAVSTGKTVLWNSVK